MFNNINEIARQHVEDINAARNSRTSQPENAGNIPEVLRGVHEGPGERGSQSKSRNAQGTRGPEGLASREQELTPAFKQWIGSSVIKEPVYHGTKKDFSEFKDADGQNYGYYFTDSPKYAEAYAGYGATGGNIRPSYVKIENPATWQQFEDALKTHKDNDQNRNSTSA